MVCPELCRVEWLFLAVLCVTAELVLVGGDRGTLDGDDQFQMLISGGFMPQTDIHMRHVVSIRTMDHIYYFGDNHFCSGVIITRETVLTAAHCVTDEFYATIPVYSVFVVFGVFSRLQADTGDNGRFIAEMYVHPGYRRYMKNDLAILRLATILPFELFYAQSIAIRSSYKVVTDGKCSIYGWGQIYKHGPYANHIMFLDVLIMNHSYCSEQIRHYDPEGNICTKPDAGGEVCAGDMGSPMMCEDQLAGIVGGAQGCDGRNAIKLVNYTYYQDWISELVVDFGSSPRISSSLTLQFIGLLVLFKLIS